MSTGRAEPRVWFAGGPALWRDWEAPLRAAFAEAGVPAVISDAVGAPEDVRYLLYARDGGLTDFAPYTGCHAVLNLWAGVEEVAGNPTLTQPLARMVDPAMTRAMVEWVLAQVLRHHIGLDRWIRGTPGVWRDDPAPPLASERRVTVLGLGALGAAVTAALAGLGFRVTGWSRSPKRIPGVACLSGPGGFSAALGAAEILVLLVPLTPATENLLDAAALARLPRGAVVINPGRGGLVDDAALRAALDLAHIEHATLDVFRIEPLPKDDPYWTHPRVTVTPHVAAATRPASAARKIAENVRRAEAGLPLLDLVDRARGY